VILLGLFMRAIGATFIALLLTGSAGAAPSPDGPPPAPWQAHGADWTALGHPDGDTTLHIALSCSARSGFTAQLLQPSAQRVLTVQAKVAPGKAIDLQAVSSGTRVSLSGIDALEDAILRENEVSLKIVYAGGDQAIRTFRFEGLAISRDRVIKQCPPF
jgi:hypothetical protein